MRKIGISDITLATAGARELSFKEKVETAKQLSRAETDCIEMMPLTGSKADIIFYHTVSGLTDREICCPISTEEGQTQKAAEALKNAKNASVNVCVPSSTVQMEYIGKKKPAAMLAAMESTLAEAAACFKTTEVTFTDATRADIGFLTQMTKKAAEVGASRITVCDDAGDMLPKEFKELVKLVKEAAGKTPVGVKCSNECHMAAAFMAEAIEEGADYVKTTALGKETVSLRTAAGLISSKGSALDCFCGVNMTVLSDCSDKILQAAEGKVTPKASLNAGSFFTGSEDITAVSQAVKDLGYDLGGNDIAAVYSEFLKTAEKKKVSLRDLDAIVAGCAMQAPPTFSVQSFVVTNGNLITPMANMTIVKNGEALSGCSVGDGPIDAAFRAIEQIVGHHTELDDFQVQAVTRGREALGSAIVKLRSGGVLYSGKGISTDIVEASIAAYISALNKIYYEEETK